jgi:hypothetical protein
LYFVALSTTSCWLLEPIVQRDTGNHASPPTVTGKAIKRTAYADGLKRRQKAASDPSLQARKTIHKTTQRPAPGMGALAAELKRADVLLDLGRKQVNRLRKLVQKSLAPTPLSQQLLRNFESLLVLQRAHRSYLAERLREAKPPSLGRARKPPTKGVAKHVQSPPRAKRR